MGRKLTVTLDHEAIAEAIRFWEENENEKEIVGEPKFYFSESTKDGCKVTISYEVEDYVSPPYPYDN